MTQPAHPFTANIQARQYAQEVALMCGEQSPRFWECLRAHCEANLPKPEPPQERCPAMDDQEAIRFEATCMPYGKYSGDLAGEVPCDYLLFLTEGDEFSQRLKRYVKSKRFQERQGDE